MEIFFKVGITIIVVVLIYFQVIFLKGVWKSQIDIKATASRLVNKLSPPAEIIVTRDPNKVYQNGKEVSEITGKVKTEGGLVIFEELCETEKLNKDIPFEYQRQNLKITKIGSIIGMKVVTSDKGSQSKRAVLSNVICQKIK